MRLRACSQAKIVGLFFNDALIHILKKSALFVFSTGLSPEPNRLRGKYTLYTSSNIKIEILFTSPLVTTISGSDLTGP